MHTGFPSMSINCPSPEGPAHFFPHQEQQKPSKDASLVEEESFFITISGLSLPDVNIGTVGVTTVAAINVFLKQSPCLSILPNSTDLSRIIILLLLLWLAKWGHIISQKTSFEKHQETVVSALLLGTEVNSRLPRTVLATSLNQHPLLQTENVAKQKKKKACYIGRGEKGGMPQSKSLPHLK